jgi:hypothetical protein
MQRIAMALVGTLVGASVTLAAACSDDEGTSSNNSAGGGTTTSTTTAEACGSESATNVALCVDKTRYVDDLTFIAQPRPPSSSHWQAVQDLCAARFAELGYNVELHSYATGVNVIGVKAGSDSEQVLVTAHYDSTDASCPGADDNATGVAATLETARVLSTLSLQRTLVVACWDEEEGGLIGSEAYATRAASQGDLIAAVFNYEMIGFTNDAPNSQQVPVGFNLVFSEQVAELEANEYRADFIAIVNDDLAAAPATALALHADAFGLPNVMLQISGGMKNNAAFSDLRRSDHASFWDFDYPAMMITDTSNFRYDAYHCGNGQDVIANLNHDFSTKVIQATVAAVVDTAVLVP